MPSDFDTRASNFFNTLAGSMADNEGNGEGNGEGSGEGGASTISGRITGQTVALLANQFDPSAKAARKVRRDMRHRLKAGAGGLGYTNAQRKAMTKDAVDAAQASLTPLTDAFNRQMAAGGPVGQGAMNANVQKIGQVAASQGGAAAAIANVESNRLANDRYNQYYNIINAQGEKNVARAEKTGQIAGDAVEEIVKAYFTGGMSAAAPAMANGAGG